MGAPRGVPLLSNWKVNRDGSITGVISGGRGFDDGAPVTTSPIKGSAQPGTTVVTKSGSRYFLESKEAKTAPLKASNKAKAAANSRREAAAAARKLAAEKAEKAKQQREAALAAKKLAAEKAKQERDSKAAAAAAAKAKAATAQKMMKGANKQASPTKVTQVKRSPTISLFGLAGSGGKRKSQQEPTPAPPAKKQKNRASLVCLLCQTGN